ncbi:integrase arm-type DNA-binding domain-containing protein [uncultured Desulfovibrio sp.]
MGGLSRCVLKDGARERREEARALLAQGIDPSERKKSQGHGP